MAQMSPCQEFCDYFIVIYLSLPLCLSLSHLLLSVFLVWLSQTLSCPSTPPKPSTTSSSSDFIPATSDYICIPAAPSATCHSARGSFTAWADREKRGGEREKKNNNLSTPPGCTWIGEAGIQRGRRRDITRPEEERPFPPLSFPPSWVISFSSFFFLGGPISPRCN